MHQRMYDVSMEWCNATERGNLLLLAVYKNNGLRDVSIGIRDLAAMFYCTSMRFDAILMSFNVVLMLLICRFHS